VWHRLNDTLFSICCQNEDNYHIMVVANELRELDGCLKQEKITCIQSNLDATALPQKDNTVIGAPAYYNHIKDKARKRFQAVMWAEHFMRPHFYAMADADDYVSRNLVKWINRVKEEVVCVNRGIIVNREQENYAEIENFVQFCGTSVIVRSQQIRGLIKLGENCPETWDRLGNHHFYHKRPHFLLQQPAAAYRMHDSNYDRRLWWYHKRWKRDKFLTKAVCREYGIR
jgi:hypothetical protein